MVTSRDTQIIGQWLQSQASPHTRGCYRRDSDRLLEHVRKPLSRISLGDLQGFAQALIDDGLAPISRARTIAAIKSLCGFCHRMRYLLVNPAEELALPRYEHRLAERVLSEGDVRRLLGSDTGERDRILLKLLYFAGLRVSEACNLRWRNLHKRGNAGQVTVFGKGGRTRSILVPAGLWSELISLRCAAASEGLVFPSRTGRPLDRGRIRTIVRQAAGRVGVAGAVSPHWLRHAHASHALDRGAPIHLVQATLGHSSVATTSGYLHARPGDSSARFLTVETIVSEASAPGLPLLPTRVMDVMTAATAASGDYTMTSNVEEAKTHENATGQPAEPKQPKASRKPAVAPQKPRVAPAKGKSGKEVASGKKMPRVKVGAKTLETAAPRKGSKTASVIVLLERKGGATLAEIMRATKWQAHSVRGFVSGTLGKKMGRRVESAKRENGERFYQLKG